MAPDNTDKFLHVFQLAHLKYPIRHLNNTQTDPYRMTLYRYRAVNLCESNQPKQIDMRKKMS